MQIGNFTSNPGREMITMSQALGDYGVQYLGGVSDAGYLTRSFTGSPVLPRLDSPHPFAAAKFRGPTEPYDIVTTDLSGSGAYMLRGDAIDSPIWQNGDAFPTAGTPWAFAAGDVDGDGFQDFAVACRNPDAVTLYRGNSSAGFDRSDIVIGPGSNMADVRIADVTGDGQAELLFVVSSGLFVAPKANGTQDEVVVPGAMYSVSLPAPETTDVPGDQPELAAAAGRVALAIAPNPVRAGATLRFALPSAGRVTLALYDVGGRRVATLADGEFSAGAHAVRLEGPGASRLGPGVYLARLETPQGAATRRFVRLR
jgi:hypothetical protein